MAKEIERKFLVRATGWQENIIKEKKIKQGYIFSSPEKTLRVRIANDKAFLTLKGKTHNISRDEFEYDLPLEDAEQMLAQYCENNIIQKIRYYILFAGKEWTIDLFEGHNKGLILAEIELENEDETIEIPQWIIKEVSFDERYFNAYLSKYPFTTWKKE